MLSFLFFLFSSFKSQQDKGVFLFITILIILMLPWLISQDINFEPSLAILNLGVILCRHSSCMEIYLIS